MSKPIRVVCVGASVKVRGGISRLFGKLQGAFPDHIRFRIVATYSDHLGDGQGMRWAKCLQPVVFLWSLVQVLAAALAPGPTVFHVHFSQRGSTLRKGVICILLRTLRCQYVVQGHGSHAMFHDWVPVIVRRALVWGICGGRYVIALTQFWREFYAEELKVPASKLLVLPNPADIPPCIPDRTNREGLKLLFLGRVGEHKGAFDLIEAFAALPEPVRDECHLTLAGDGETDRAQSLLDQLGCSTRASVLGWVSAQDVDRLLAESDVLLLPSRGEGMSMALLEGMAWGLAVVASSAGGAEDFLEANQSCILVDPGDVAGISKAIATLAADPEFRQRLSAGARNAANRLSMDQYVATLTRLYEELARNPSTHDPEPAVETRPVPTSSPSAGRLN